jgi:hypothetical protein
VLEIIAAWIMIIGILYVLNSWHNDMLDRDKSRKSLVMAQIEWIEARKKLWK